VSDTFPGTLTGVTYNSTFNGTVSDTNPTGSSPLSDTITLNSGSSITYYNHRNTDLPAPPDRSWTTVVVSPRAASPTHPRQQHRLEHCRDQQERRSSDQQHRFQRAIRRRQYCHLHDHRHRPRASDIVVLEAVLIVGLLVRELRPVLMVAVSRRCR